MSGEEPEPNIGASHADEHMLPAESSDGHEPRRGLPLSELHRRLWLIYSMAFKAAQRDKDAPGDQSRTFVQDDQ
jgi:hypothetical protein